MKRLLFALALVGCSDPAATPVDAAPGADAAVGSDAPGAMLALTSAAYAEGGVIPVDNSCKGANTSPPLAWTGAPSATQSFAIVLTDKSNGFVHWAIFDIPATTTTLPANVEKRYMPANVAGARQVGLQPQTQGYAGPCPPDQHTYELAVYPLDLAMLPGATMQSAPKDLVPTIRQHQLGVGTLTATFTPAGYASSNSLQNATSVGRVPSGLGASSGQRR
jgi:Raf kinase inhibitor-like YbhB/YbcL family protein